MFEPHLRQLGAMEDQGEVELGRGDVISTTDLRTSPGEYPVYSSSAVGIGQFGRYGKYMFDEDLITWSVDGGGRPFLRKKHKFSVTNVSGFLRIRKPDVWNYGYLHAAMVKAHQRIQFDYQMKAHPSVIRELYKLRWVPLDEQQKIAQILNTLDTQIQKTEALITKLGKIKEGLVRDLLTRGIDQNGELRPAPEQSPELYKESALGLIPRAWDVSDLGSASVSSVIGPFGSDLVASDYRNEGVPVIFVRDIAGARYDRVSQVFVSQRKAQALSAHEVKDDDLLLTKMGLPPCISAVYPKHEPPGIITADIVRLRLRDNVAPDWAHYFVNSHTVKAQVRGITAGVTRPKVTLKDVRSLKIAVPDIEEQARILNILQRSSSRLKSESSNLEKLHAQKSGLMDDLLTGRVRVTPLLKDAV
jgi:restriction endonuclease S subunit